MFIPPSAGFIIVMKSEIDSATVQRLKDAWMNSYPEYVKWSTPVFRSRPSYNHNLKRLIKRRS